MERLRRISQFWNWLPAFRAVAESEHLPTAAKEVGVGATGLSRMVRLLEDDLGVELFEREARKLVLNEAGRIFLVHVRNAMRIVDDGMNALKEAGTLGVVRISASASASLTYVVPAAAIVSKEHPRVVPELCSLTVDEACHAVLKGHIDLAVIENAEVPNALSVELLGVCTYGIYCGDGHVLSRDENVTLEQCLKHDFVGPALPARDAWPPNVRRQVAMQVSSLGLGLDVCASGRLLALLPDEVAERYPGRLVRLPVATMSEQKIFLAYRPPLGTTDRVSVFMDALREVGAATNSGLDSQDPSV